MKKGLLFCGLLAIASFNFIACDDDDDNNSNNNTTNNNSKKEEGNKTESRLSAEFVSASDCLGSPYGDSEGTRADVDENKHKLPSLVYKYDQTKGELALSVENATLTCGSEPKMDLTFSGDTIIVKVYDSSDKSNLQKCQCLYNVSSIVKGVENKVYYVRPINEYDVEESKVLELSQKAEGSITFDKINSIIDLK